MFLSFVCFVVVFFCFCCCFLSGGCFLLLFFVVCLFCFVLLFFGRGGGGAQPLSGFPFDRRRCLTVPYSLYLSCVSHTALSVLLTGRGIIALCIWWTGREERSSFSLSLFFSFFLSPLPLFFSSYLLSLWVGLSFYHCICLQSLILSFCTVYLPHKL